MSRGALALSGDAGIPYICIEAVVGLVAPAAGAGRARPTMGAAATGRGGACCWGIVGGTVDPAGGA